MKPVAPIVLVVLAVTATFIYADDEGWNESGIGWASSDAAWDERGNKVRVGEDTFTCIQIKIQSNEMDLLLS